MACGEGGADAGGLTGGGGVTGDAVAGMGIKVAAEAASGEKKAIAIACDEGAHGQTVGPGAVLGLAVGEALGEFGIGGVHIDPEGTNGHGIFGNAAGQHIVHAYGMEPVDTAAFADTDLLGGGDEAKVFPDAALFSQSLHNAGDLATRADGCCGEGVGIITANAVLVIGDEAEQVVVNGHHDGRLVAGLDPAGLNGFKEAMLGLVMGAPDIGFDLIKEEAGQNGGEAERLDFALAVAHIEAATGHKGEIAIAGCIDEHSCRPCFATGFGFGNGDREPVGAVAGSGDDAGVEADFNARLLAELFEEDFHDLRIVGVIGTAGLAETPGAPPVQFRSDFRDKARLVGGINDPAKEPRRPDAPEAAMVIDQDNAGTCPGGGEGGADAGRAGTGNHDIRAFAQGQFAFRFMKSGLLHKESVGTGRDSGLQCFRGGGPRLFFRVAVKREGIPAIPGGGMPTLGAGSLAGFKRFWHGPFGSPGKDSDMNWNRAAFKITPSGELSIHYPRQLPELCRAVLVFVHGGGWTGGSPEMLYALAEALAGEGILPLLPEYRLLQNTGSGGIAEPVADAADAWAWAETFLGGHPELRALPRFRGGGSAGGHLSLMARAEYPEPFGRGMEPAGWILGNPVVNTSKEGFGNELLGREWEAYSPHVQVPSLSSPVLYLQGTADDVTSLPLAQSYVKTLRANGTQVDLELADGAGHGFFNAPAFCEWTVGAIRRFMRSREFGTTLE